MSSDYREIQLKISSHEPDLRLDRYLARQIAGLSRTRIQALMAAELITIAGVPVKPAHPVRCGEIVLLRIPGVAPSPLLPEDLPLEVHYEDDHLIVVNKSAGMVVHPAYGHPNGTLINALLFRCHDLAGISGTARPGLVHRLDKDTSGLLVVAKNEITLTGLAQQFKEKTALRRYRAIVWGKFHPPEGRIEAPLGRSPRDRKKFDVLAGGKEAATRYKTLERFELFSLVELQLETGRTHQIRIHMQHAHHPVFGDPQYGGRNRRLGVLTSTQRAFVAGLFEILPRQALHAGLLGFRHPVTGEELVFEREFPEDMHSVLKRLRAENCR